MRDIWVTNALLGIMVVVLLLLVRELKQFTAQFRMGIMDPVQRVYYDRQGVFVTDFFEFLFDLDDFYEAIDYRGIIEMNVSRILRIGYEKFDQEDLVRTGKFTALLEELIDYQQSPYMPVSVGEKVIGLLQSVDDNLNVTLRTIIEESFKEKGGESITGEASYNELVNQVEKMFSERANPHEGQWEALVTEVRILIG